MHITIMCYVVITYILSLKTTRMKYGLYTKPVHVTIYFPI